MQGHVVNTRLIIHAVVCALSTGWDGVMKVEVGWGWYRWKAGRRQVTGGGGGGGWWVGCMQVLHLVGDSPMLLNVSLTTPLPTRYFRSSTSNVLRSRSLRVKNKIVKIKMISSKYYLSLTHTHLSTCPSVPHPSSLMPTHHKDVSIYLEIYYCVSLFLKSTLVYAQNVAFSLDGIHLGAWYLVPCFA